MPKLPEKFKPEIEKEAELSFDPEKEITEADWGEMMSNLNTQRKVRPPFQFLV